MTPACDRCGVIHPLAYWVERSWLCFDCRRRYSAPRRSGHPAGASARGEPWLAEDLKDRAVLVDTLSPAGGLSRRRATDARRTVD